jgi:hypothetical protein
MHWQNPRRKQHQSISLHLWLISLLLISGAAISRPAPMAPEPTVCGVVKDAQGSPVANARIRLLDPLIARQCPDLLIGSMANLWLAEHPLHHEGTAASQPHEVSTDGQGRFQFTLPPETADAIVLIEGSGLPPHLDRLEAGNPHKMLLVSGSDLKVRVMAEDESDKLVEGARGTLVPLFLCAPALVAYQESLVWRAQSGADGEMEFRRIPKGTYALRLAQKNQRVSVVGPILVESGIMEIRVRLPWGPPFRGSLSYPSHTPRSAGTVYAFWKGSKGRLEWSEASFSPDSDEFEIDPPPFDESVRFLARTDSGLSSRLLSMERFAKAEGEGGSMGSIPLLRSVSWRGNLEEGVKVSSIIAEPLAPSLLPSSLLSRPLVVAVEPGGGFVVPDVSPSVEAMRLMAPGIGSAEVRLEDSGSGDLGVVKLVAGPFAGGRIRWPNGDPLVHGEVEVLSSLGTECRARVTEEGEFGCVPQRSGSKGLDFRVWLTGVSLPFEALPGKETKTLILDPGGNMDFLFTRPGGRVKVEDLKLELDSTTVTGGGNKVFFARTPLGALRMHQAGRKVRLAVSNPVAGAEVPLTLDISSSAGGRRTPIVLPEGESVFGTVASALSRKPIENAEIEIAPGSVFSDEVRVSYVTHSGAEGSWRFREAQEGSCELVAVAPNFAQARKRVSVPGEAGSLPQLLLLQQFGRIQGKVIGLPGEITASVRIWPRAAWLASNQTYKATPNEKGEFLIESVQPDRYEVSLNVKKSAEEGTSRRMKIEVRPAETTQVVIDLEATIAVSGKATLAGEPLPRARVSFMRISKNHKRFDSMDVTTTDDGGSFKILLPKPGSYKTNAQMQQVSTEKADRMLQLGRFLEIGTETSQRQDLRFSSGKIRGRTVDEEGHPIGDVYVEIQLQDRNEKDETSERDPVPLVEGGAFSTSDGSFESNPLPAGRYRLSFNSGGFAHQKIGPIFLEQDQTMALPDTVLRRESSVSVKVLGPQGEPLSKAYVSAFRSFGFEDRRHSGGGTTDEEGLAQIKGLSSGIYTLVARSPGCSPAFLENFKVPPEKTDVPILQCQPGGSLEVQVLTKAGLPVPDLIPILIDAQGRDVTNIHLTFSSATEFWTNGEGRAKLLHIAPGEYVIKAGRSANADSKKVTISTGNTAQVFLISEEEPEE